MATDFMMPRMPGQQQQSQSPYYARQQHQRQQFRAQQLSFQPTQIATAQPSPVASQYNSPISPLSSSGNISPSTNKSYITRQIRPLYVPAVLRPTEFPSKEPPHEASPQDEDDISEEATPRPNSSFMNLGSLTPFGRLSRRSTGDSAKCLDGKWELDLFPEPTGPPTRKHWKPDHESTICDHATCKRYFSYFTRRHHCRKCGNIFCDAHSAFEVPLDQDANFNPRGAPSRACNHCYAQFKEWRTRSNGRPLPPDAAAPPKSPYGHNFGYGFIPNHGQSQPNDINSNNRNQESRFGTPTSPVTASPSSSAGFGLPTHPHPDVAQSVPRDWNWSTF
ncbi:hypothetical protein VTK26DRAFT_4840 [Humicola hyalothermophila]